MNILLTGGTGYLGSHLLRALVKDRHEQVTVLVREGSHLERISELAGTFSCFQIDLVDFRELIESKGIDTIVHCATNYGRTRVSRADMVDANLVLPLRLLDAAAAVSRKVTFINTDTMLDKSVSEYSMSKKQFRDWLRVYADTGVCINLALEHFFGPGDDPSKFATFIVRALLRNDARVPLTPGNQERDFIYIDDVVDAFLVILSMHQQLPNGFFDFELGRGEPMALRVFVELAKRLCGNSTTVLDFGALPHRKNEVMRVAAKTEGIRALGWEPKVDIERGLRCMIEKERLWLENTSS
jgi:CDP-paratose synthetase